MVTGEQVKAAAMAAKIHSIPHHQCSVCGSMVRYFVEGDQLYFDPSCDCSGGEGPEPRSWSSAANWINMQSSEEHRIRISKLFGL